MHDNKRVRQRFAAKPHRFATAVVTMVAVLLILLIAAVTLCDSVPCESSAKPRPSGGTPWPWQPLTARPVPSCRGTPAATSMPTVALVLWLWRVRTPRYTPDCASQR